MPANDNMLTTSSCTPASISTDAARLQPQPEPPTVPTRAPNATATATTRSPRNPASGVQRPPILASASSRAPPALPDPFERPTVVHGPVPKRTREQMARVDGRGLPRSAAGHCPRAASPLRPFGRRVTGRRTVKERRCDSGGYTKLHHVSQVTRVSAGSHVLYSHRLRQDVNINQIKSNQGYLR